VSSFCHHLRAGKVITITTEWFYAKNNPPQNMRRGGDLKFLTLKELKELPLTAALF